MIYPLYTLYTHINGYSTSPSEGCTHYINPHLPMIVRGKYHRSKWMITGATPISGTPPKISNTTLETMVQQGFFSPVSDAKPRHASCVPSVPNVPRCRSRTSSSTRAAAAGAGPPEMELDIHRWRCFFWNFLEKNVFERYEKEGLNQQWRNSLILIITLKHSHEFTNESWGYILFSRFSECKFSNSNISDGRDEDG